MSERCPARLQPLHRGAQPVRCKLDSGDHQLHYGNDHEPPRIARRWLDTNGAAIVDSQGGRIRGDAS